MGKIAIQCHSGEGQSMVADKIEYSDQIPAFAGMTLRGFVELNVK